MTLKDFLNSHDRFAANNGMCLVEVGSGSAVAEMTVGECHLNGAGICQGGALFTFADLAIAGAMNSWGNVTVGLENTITFHRPARLGDHLTAKASVTCNHGKVPFSRVEIFNEADELLASGSSLGYRKSDKFEFESLM